VCFPATGDQRNSILSGVEPLRLLDWPPFKSPALTATSALDQTSAATAKRLEGSDEPSKRGQLAGPELTLPDASPFLGPYRAGALRAVFQLESAALGHTKSVEKVLFSTAARVR